MEKEGMKREEMGRILQAAEIYLLRFIGMFDGLSVSLYISTREGKEQITVQTSCQSDNGLTMMGNFIQVLTPSNFKSELDLLEQKLIRSCSQIQNEDFRRKIKYLEKRIEELERETSSNKETA